MTERNLHINFHLHDQKYLSSACGSCHRQQAQPIFFSLQKTKEGTKRQKKGLSKYFLINLLTQFYLNSRSYKSPGGYFQILLEGKRTMRHEKRVGLYKIYFTIKTNYGPKEAQKTRVSPYRFRLDGRLIGPIKSERAKLVSLFVIN